MTQDQATNAICLMDRLRTAINDLTDASDKERDAQEIHVAARRLATGYLNTVNDLKKEIVKLLE